MNEFVPPTTRRITQRPVTFEQWLDLRGIDRREVASESEEADYVGAMLFPRVLTKAERGKLAGIERRIARRRALLAQYETEVTPVEVEVPLDLNREDDAAYLRVARRRWERMAGLR